MIYLETLRVLLLILIQGYISSNACHVRADLSFKDQVSTWGDVQKDTFGRKSKTLTGALLRLGLHLNLCLSLFVYTDLIY